MTFVRACLGRLLAVLLVVLGLAAVTGAPASGAERDGPISPSKPPTKQSLVDDNVAGTVIQPPGGPSIDGWVSVYAWDDGFEEFAYDSDVEVSDAAPQFAFTLAPGSYYLDYSDFDGAYEYTTTGGDSGPPSSPGDPGVLVVTETSSVTVDLEPRPYASGDLVATGTLTSGAGGSPLDGGSVTSYLWDQGDEEWETWASAPTGSDGTFAVEVPEASTVTFRFSASRHQTTYYGGGGQLPASPAPGNNVVVGGADVALGAIALAPRPSDLGTVAGQVLPYCASQSLEPNDDGSSGEIDVPFPMTYFGNPQSMLFVNNNGNVTFGSALSQFTPSSLTGNTGRAIVAPFFADFDTSGLDSGVTTYGTSPDGTTFCAQWADLGYFSRHTDKLNTVQLLLRSTQDQPGRSPGDFDIVFNYDSVEWESGDASGGAGGLGGTSAAAGFSAGTGTPGSFVQLAGSLVNGALLDGGPNALVAGSQGSSQPGRYVFEVRNAGQVTTYGSMSGTVTTSGGAPVADAYVQSCLVTGFSCNYTTTNGAGAYSFAALPAGQQAITVHPPTDALFAGGTTATVTPGASTTVPPIVLAAPIPLPTNVTLTNNGIGTNGVPSVYYGEPLDLAVTGCPGVANPTYTVTIGGVVVRNQVPMAQGPAGVYSATIPEFYPDHGDALITTNIPATCGGPLTQFNVYIDPSGTVTDQWGRPIDGATVTLLRSEEADGTYAMVPDGSDVMSPSNRSNPDLTDDHGFFRWDVTPGWYRVKVEAPGCDTVTTAGMQVPPERIDLVIRTTCAGLTPPAATAAPTVTGNPQVGGTLTAAPATWAAPLAGAGLELLRNGVPLAGTSRSVTAADVGAVFTARATGRRPDYVDASQGLTVTFLPVVALSAGVTAVAAPAPPSLPAPPPAPPAPTPTPAATALASSSTSITLSAKKVKKGGKVKVTVKVTVGAGGTPSGTVSIMDGKRLLKKVAVGSNGKAVITLKKLKKGKHKIRAAFSGNATTLPSLSKVMRLKAA